MAMEYFIIYDLTAGAEIMRGSGPQGTAALQVPPTGYRVLPLPEPAMQGDLADHTEDVRLAVWEQVKARRDAVIAGGVMTPFGLMQSDEDSRLNVAGAAAGAMIAAQLEQPFSVSWTLADNSTQTFTGVQMMQVGMLFFAHVASAHEAARVLRLAVEGAESVEDLLKIDTQF